MLRRILAVLHARNLEFLRDRSSLAWNVVLPVALVAGLAVIFSGGERAEYTVGVLGAEAPFEGSLHPFFETRYVEFVPAGDEAGAVRKIARHQLDLLIRPGDRQRYWVNPDSPRGYILERVLLESDPRGIEREVIGGEAVRYVDWVLPGILGMNMMFSCLFGVGYVVVRYRKNGFLKRLKATPLNALEFVVAQVLSRLILIMTITCAVFLAVRYLLDIRMEGSYTALFVVALVGSIALISLGLLVAARVSSEELAGGLLNMATWPMLLLSGVWFSLEGASPWLQQAAKALPLTLVLDAARAIMIDGAGLGGVAVELTALTLMAGAFMLAGAVMFRWRHP